MSITLISKQLQNKDHDKKSEYLFRTCYIPTNLVTSLEFNTNGGATLRYHHGQTRNGIVANRLIQSRSTSTSSATIEFVAVPDRVSQTEE